MGMDMSVLPLSTGTDHSSVGGSTLGAFAGALFGSWFGDGFGRNGYGYGVNGAAGVGAGVVANSLTDPALLDAINSNGVKLDQSTIANLQGFAALQNANNQGFAGLQNTTTVSTANIQNTLAQGFSGNNAAIIAQGYEARLASSDVVNAVNSCCCKTTSTIIEEGAKTRQLIQDNLITELQTALCDSKAKVAQLEVENKLVVSQAAQTATILAAISHAA